MSQSSDPTSSLIDETLRSMKSMKVKQINYRPCEVHQLVALLDGGATHGLRTAEVWERKGLEPVQVELASGSTRLYRHRSHRTLLSLDDVEPIVPLHRLVAMGFKIEWTSKGCRIFHPSRGVIACSLRGGCPIMDRGNALLLLKEMEKVDGSSLDVDVNEFKWWQENFPDVPDRIIRKLVSPVEPWDPAALPWNRHQKKGVALHLFCGPNVKKRKDCEVGGLEWLCVDSCLGSQYDLHRPAVWGLCVGASQQRPHQADPGGPSLPVCFTTT